MASNPTLRPQYKVITFKCVDETNYYERVSCPPGFEKVPTELWVEETRRPDIIKADQIIRGKEKNATSYKFFTGLRRTQFLEFYHGNYYEFINGVKKNSFILFRFTDDTRILTIYFFNLYKVYEKRIKKIVPELITQIKKEGSVSTLSVPNHLTGHLFHD